MKKPKGILQRVAAWSGMASFAMAAVCAVILYFKVKSTGFNNPVSASFLASVFFFIFAGVLLGIIGKSDLPSFKFDNKQNGQDENK
jgi:hypothetical protein